MAVRRRSSRSARGQHFLRSSRLAEALVRDAGVAPGDLVLDIGAGTGALTRALLEAGAHVVAVERDAALAADLRTRFGERVSIVEANALDWPLPTKPFAVVANLPFAGSGAILKRLLDGPVVHADVIVEWAFAQKHAAIWPATLKGTYWRAFYEMGIARRLDRTAFTPPPSVHAAVLRFVRRAEPLVPPAETRRYRQFLSKAFNARTEVRRSVLTPRHAKRLAATLGFAPNARPRDLDARQWASVYASVRRPRQAPAASDPGRVTARPPGYDGE